MIFLKASTASQEVLLGPFVDATDGVTAETALTIANTDIKIFKAGATTLANKNSGGATHISNGNYYAVLDATDTDTVGSGSIVVQVSGALAVRVNFCVLPAVVYDSLIGGTDTLQVDVTQFGGTNATTSGGRPEVNTTHAAGTAWGSGAITAGSIASDAFTAAKFAADVTTEFQSGLATAAALATVDGIVDNMVSGIIFGSAATGTLSTTQATSNLSGYGDDQLIGRVIIWLTGNCEGEASTITDYASASGLLTFDALTTAPANADTFKIV